jgi:sugar lactone lactonase YvrE
MSAPLNVGDVLVADETAGTIHQYSATGTDLGVFAEGLTAPAWLAADALGNIYVSEYTGRRIDKLSSSGTLLLTFTTPFAAGGVAVGRDGTIYVGDYDHGNVYRYSSAGAPLGLFVSTGLSRADFLAVDGSGNLYVDGGEIHRISPAGTDQLISPQGLSNEGLAFDSSGNLYAAMPSLSIRKYSPTGADLGPFVSGDTLASAGVSQPYGIAFDSGGNLYVANFSGGNIRKFSPAGADLGNFVTGLVNPRDVLVVRVKGAESIESIADLLALVESLDLARLVERRLDAKLRTVATAISLACNRLEAVSKEVRVLFKTIPPEKAAQIIDGVNTIEGLLHCQ